MAREKSVIERAEPKRRDGHDRNSDHRWLLLRRGHWAALWSQLRPCDKHISERTIGGSYPTSVIVTTAPMGPASRRIRSPDLPPEPAPMSQGYRTAQLVVHRATAA